MNDMRAIVITKYGGPEVLQQARLPIPKATEDVVTVRVRAFGLNQGSPWDSRRRRRVHVPRHTR